jgi:hypothetical protein
MKSSHPVEKIAQQAQLNARSGQEQEGNAKASRNIRYQGEHGARGKRGAGS